MSYSSGKSGKSGGDMSYSSGKSGKSGGSSSSSDFSLPYCSSGKSGKSGGGSGKSGKSGGDMSYSSGKSGKSGGSSSSSDGCVPKPSPSPSICAPTDSPTIITIPTPCSCDDPTEDWKYIFVDGKCTLTIDMCADDDAMSLTGCCDANDYPFSGDKECPIDNSICIPTPAPSTPAPSPSPTFITISTLNPTEQGTVTVAKESDGADTQGDREGV